jgi:hypothetical protein
VDVQDVGPLPTLPPPNPGERIKLRVAGRPPVKTYGQSMRNARSPQRPHFMALRHAAIDVMAGRKWYEGAVELRLRYSGPKEALPLHPYIDGILDTLDGCQGPSIIYLPIVYLDDCQVVGSTARWTEADTESYELEVEFL